MGNINLKQLEIFAAVVECGSFTEAANQLYMAQSTVSSHIHALEAILLTPLFHRGAKKNGALTDDGKRVYQLAKDVLEKCRDLETGMVEEKGSELRLGTSTAPGCQLVPSYVAAFYRRRPDCCVSLKHGDSGGIQEMLLEREIQLGFVGSADNRQELSYECIAKDRLVLIAFSPGSTAPAPRRWWTTTLPAPSSQPAGSAWPPMSATPSLCKSWWRRAWGWPLCPTSPSRSVSRRGRCWPSSWRSGQWSGTST